MLRLTARSARGASPLHFCNACRATHYAPQRIPSWPARPPAVPQHVRLLRSSSRRQDELEKQQTASAVDLNTDVAETAHAEDGSQEAPATTPAKKKGRAASTKKAAGGKPKPVKAAKATTAPALQGAIETFKKVLADQNIDLAHLAQILDQKPPAPKKAKKPKKEKTKDKKTKGAETSKDGETKTKDKADERKAKKKARKESSKATTTETSGETPTTTKTKVKTAQSTPSPTVAEPLETSGTKAILPQPSLWIPTGEEAGVGGSRSDALGKPFGEANAAEEGAGAELKKLAISTISSSKLELTPIGKLTIPVPRLAHGLDRVLFNPGVYFLQDPRSRVFNFDPYLANIMPIQEFDFNALKQYITSSKDTTLISKAREHKKRYTGSTSSMTAMLSHFHYLLSAWRPVNSTMMSADFKPESQRFTRIMRAPAATFLHWKDGCYAIDADKEFDSANILSMLGKSMEKLLTLPKQKFEQYRHANSDQISEEERNAEEAFHYTAFQDFMMRSQLDAYDKRVPGTGMFDLKTRAVVSIRMDAANFHQGLGYEIRHRHGQWESFEREYYDMIRSAFLKYSLQVRMGRMDGIYVAYHNTERIFGFQYIPIPEMDFALHGTNNTTLGDREYKLSLKLLNELLDRASERWPEQSLRIHFETRESTVAPFMYVFARPVESGDIEAVQNAGKAQVEEFERTILGLKKADHAKADTVTDTNDTAQTIDVEPNVSASKSFDQSEKSTAEADAQRLAVWGEVQQVVEDAMSDEEVGISSVREAIQDALEESSLLEVEDMAETRQYIDALLTAITGVQAPDVNIEQDQARVDGSEDSDTVADTGMAGKASDISHSDTAPSTAHEQDTTAQTAETISAQDSSAPNSEAVPTLEDSTDVKRLLVAKSSLSPLKDLIALSAQRLHDRPAAEAETEGSTDDSQKLKVFEKILGRMITQAKAEQSTSQHPAVTNATAGVTVESGTSDANRSASEHTTESLDPEGGEEGEAENLAADETMEGEEEYDFELLGMVLTIKNKVNGEYVERPNNLTKDDEWDVEYNIEEIPETRAHKLYEQCQARRKMIFTSAQEKASFESMFAGQLARATNKGREFRKKETSFAKRQPVHIYGSHRGFAYRDIFGYLNRSGAGATKTAPVSSGKASRGGIKRVKHDKKQRGLLGLPRPRHKKQWDGKQTAPAAPTAPLSTATLIAESEQIGPST